MRESPLRKRVEQEILTLDEATAVVILSILQDQHIIHGGNTMKNELTLVKSEHFGEIEADIYSNGNDMFMTINQLADCLEYADKKSVENLIDRNPYLKNEEFSFIQKVPLNTGGTQNTRTFTEDGIYEITMLSGQPKAKEFRAWIRGILKALRSGKAKIIGMT